MRATTGTIDSKDEREARHCQLFYEKLLERRGFTGEPHWNLEEIVSMSRGLEMKGKEAIDSLFIANPKPLIILHIGSVLNK